MREVLLCSEQVTRLPSELGPGQPGWRYTNRRRTTCNPAQPVGGVSSSSITARASLRWSRLRELLHTIEAKS